ncbi:PASTA domain-containing protein [Kordia sp.]|uniref:PASTA domain-containing protein n=1 Tax=Kordia sp. TaxID=1965332 RepID=UPI0025C1C2ED|nr:PASTA domain-containing protein [Kordia sp.]MCH2196134.1 hypothetical protein [Kordia sp.]
MAINIQSIQFQHILYDASNKAAKTIKVQVQFYNVNTKSWLALTDALALRSGKLAYTLTIPSRISTKNQTVRVVREVLKSGGTPSFRIINANSQAGLPEVIATTFNVTITGDSKITLNFNKSWLLDPKKYITKSDHIVIASEVPMFELMSSIRVIEEEKDNAIAQISGLNSTITSLYDERESLRTQLATAQSNIQNSSQEVADLNASLEAIRTNLTDERTLVETLETQIATQREQLETLESSSGDISAIAIERDTALAEVTQLNDSVSSLTNERTALQNQLKNAQNDLGTKEQQVADLSIDLQTVSSNLASERELRKTLETDKANLETQLAAQRTQIENMEAVNVSESNFEVLYNDLQVEVANINIVKTNLEQQVSDLTIVKDNLEQEKVSFLTSISQLQETVRQEKALVIAKETEIQNKQTLVETLERDNQKLQQELEEARDFTVTDHPNKLSASKVYGSIVNDVIKADEELVNSKYKLANISLNLKTTVEKGPNGTVFGLLDYESAKEVNSAAISDISIDIVPSGNTATSVAQKMPNILGLTETAVRKVLLNNSLKLDAVYHATNDNSLIAGQSFKQSPAPDAAVEEGQEVIVIFAKPIN